MQVNELLDECQFDLQTRKWASDANEYLQLLAKVISKVSFKKTNYQNQADKPVSVQIDKEHALSVEPIGFTKVPLAWTKKSGNAQVLPTFFELEAKCFPIFSRIKVRFCGEKSLKKNPSCQWIFFVDNDHTTQMHLRQNTDGLDSLLWKINLMEP